MTEVSTGEGQLGKEQKLPELRPFDKTVLNDLKSSFRHSQGFANLQYKLLVIGAKNYKEQEGTEAIGSIDALEERITPHIDKLVIPSSHVATFSDGRPIADPNTLGESVGFHKAWNADIAILHNIIDGTPIAPVPPIDEVSKDIIDTAITQTEFELSLDIAKDILARDSKYHASDKPRPNRRPDQDARESFFRTHVIEGKPTGSQVYDSLFKSIRTTVEELGLTTTDYTYPPKDLIQRAHEMGISEFSLSDLITRLAVVKEGWEGFHPDETFFPQATVSSKLQSEDTQASKGRIRRILETFRKRTA